jgi:hypothetical protein
MVEFNLTSATVRDSGYRELEFVSANLFLTVVGGNFRYSYAPGQNPTTTSGHRGYPGIGLLFKEREDVVNLRMIAENNDVQITITHKAS